MKNKKNNTLSLHVLPCADYVKAVLDKPINWDIAAENLG